MKNLSYYLSGGMDKHTDGSFTVYGYIENKEGEEVATHKCRYMDYSIKEAKARFKQELQQITEELEEYKILTHQQWLEF